MNVGIRQVRILVFDKIYQMCPVPLNEREMQCLCMADLISSDHANGAASCLKIAPREEYTRCALAEGTYMDMSWYLAQQEEKDEARRDKTDFVPNFILANVVEIVTWCVGAMIPRLNSHLRKRPPSHSPVNLRLPLPWL